MNKRYLSILVIVASVLSGLYVGLFQFLPGYIIPYVWCTFVGLAVTFALGANWRMIPNYISSAVAGLFWAEVYFYIIMWLMGVGVSPFWTMLISVTVVTSVFCGIHMLITDKTWINQIPLMFAVVACFFNVAFGPAGNNATPVLTVLVAVIGGICLACSFGPISDLIYKNKSEVTDISA